MGQRSDICETPLLSELYARAGRAKPELATMRQIDAYQGHLHRRFKIVHIAGTNGKGSVCYKIATALQAEGYKVGLYTSPHIETFHERIRINGQMISQEAIETLLPPLLHLNLGTFFELTTALAFAYFAAEEIDIAVLEVGLGGRYDATNVVHPILSVITSIHYDHMHLLGNTLEEIAQEKAGIIKPNAPYVLGPRVPLEGVLRAKPASGFYDSENSAIAKLALEVLGVSHSSIEAGLKVRPPCRFEVIDGRFVLDVAHNPDGIEKLIQAAHSHFPDRKLHFIAAFSQDKDVAECLKILRSAGRVTCANGSYPRLMKFDGAPDVKAALRTVAPDEIGIVCGSFYIMADARRSIIN
ncbi:MAG: bifunctional folylpolyglutamate synthase/dihydrofolate synthase [Verrucomicrobia bacterium]|nr:bifunctional folylpolyglutamate synthase/dihydrofolate synthase [Verrucomicrobiota bacterium]